MPQYSYKAKSGPGELKTGTVTAENETAVARKLKLDGLFPVSIEETNPAPRRSVSGKVTGRDISTFTRQLANLVHAGFSISRAMATLIQQAQDPAQKKLIQDLHARIEKGATLSEALAAHPQLFSSFYVSMARIGETTGRIDETLQRLADFREKNDELVSQVRAALVYPAFLFIVGILTIVVLMTFFVPRLIVMFADFGQALPLLTQAVMSASGFLNKFWWLIVLAIAALIVLGRAYYKDEKKRVGVDNFFLRLPKAGTVIQLIEVSRFSYALAMLLQSGIPMLNALSVVTLSMDNRFYRQKVSSFQEKISKGKSLSSCFAAEKIFPPLLANMAAVGEESGELPDMLFRIAQTFESEVNRNVKTIVSLIEPALILFIGGIVVVLVFAILLPIFQLDFFTQ